MNSECYYTTMSHLIQDKAMFYNVYSLQKMSNTIDTITNNFKLSSFKKLEK